VVVDGQYHGVGSFSEVTMAFDLRPDTPGPVLAAFSELAQPLPEHADWGPAPKLPTPVTEPSEWWVPDWREEGSDDPYADEPWRHSWAPWLRSNAMNVGVAPFAALTWLPIERWQLTCRCSFKSWAEAIHTFLEWLGPFIDGWGNGQPRFVGYIADEGSPRPFLLWAHEGRLVMEDLNQGGS
jgi:hypothetical protein